MDKLKAKGEYLSDIQSFPSCGPRCHVSGSNPSGSLSNAVRQLSSSAVSGYLYQSPHPQISGSFGGGNTSIFIDELRIAG